MQKCVKCQNKFKYKEILRQQWRNSLICSKCNTKHKSSTTTNIIIAFFIIVAPPFMLTYVFRIFGLNRLLFTIPWIFLVVLLSPIYAKYNLKIDKTSE